MTPRTIAIAVLLLPALLVAADAKTKYTLRYKLKAGDHLRWNVAHQANIRTTAGGSTQRVETESESVKVWRVIDVADNGQLTFVHSVDSVRMRHQARGREAIEVAFPLPSGKKAPLGYESVGEDVGVPLTKVVMNARGEVVERIDLRRRKKASTTGYEGPLTIPLPEQGVSVGERWTEMHLVLAPRKDRTRQRVKLQQRFQLQSVENGIATIGVESVVLTPIDDPTVKIHLVQSKTRGTVKFDMTRGRIVEQNLSLDEEIIGAPLGDASSTHYQMQFKETLMK